MDLQLRQYRDLLLKYLKPQWSLALFLLLLLLINMGLALLNPQMIRIFIDTISSGGAISTLISTALLFLVVAVLKQCVAVCEGYMAENLSQLATNHMRSELMLHCLQLDPAFHTSHTPGELIERIDGDVSTLGNFFSRFLVALFGNLLLILGVLILLYRIDWRVGLIVTTFCFICLIVLYRLRNLSANAWERERQASADLFGFIEERLAGTEDIRSSGGTLYMLRGLAEKTRQRVRMTQRAAIRSSVSWIIPPIFFAAGSAVALAMGVYLFREGSATLGTVYLIFGYTNLINDPLQEIVRQMRDLQQASGSIKRVLDLFKVHSTIQDGKQNLPDGPLSIVFDDVSFAYAQDVPVLKHISFSQPAGTVMGLLGRTGSGKSTITKLLTRLYDPQQGAIRVGSNDLCTLQLASLRSSIGMVTQDVQILHATVRDNLTLFDTNIPDGKIVQALEELGLAQWYESLPEGLDTVLAPGGSGLSAGEAQLISFARVFLKDPRIVILDEASSRLDPATERRLEHAVDRLMESRTGIIIAHRLATVLHADTILILEDGSRCEYGKREELARNPDSRFAHLLRTGLEEVMI
ncbi:helicase [Reticulibacter mediterranei]|uniref:Helicase n=1 Tax=Reticulibacter mediterranei TaxID=2778369 RepID=A0A8J3IPR6_9CHLR|nr:ABC transporter ATP-binding protein [Reticulibacter mediterranei]GHO94141.1 helicase [Reticulibacter mediterranei]